MPATWRWWRKRGGGRPAKPLLRVLAGELPRVELPADVDGVRVHELLVGAGLAKSNGEVARLLTQGGVRVNARVLDGEGRLAASDLLARGFLLLRKGKRNLAGVRVGSA